MELNKLVIMEILPELDMGGVEDHVVDLSNYMASQGHEVIVVSSGGRLESELDGPLHVKLPVSSKNPLSILAASIRLSREIKKRKCQILHAHSRVPGYIAWISSKLTGIPWIYSAQACYSHNIGIYPLKKADYLVCVSNAVKEHLAGYLPENNCVILDGAPETDERWKPENNGTMKFIFVGRLTKIKGVHTVISALSQIKYDNWRFDILGDGPQIKELEKLSYELGVNDKVVFHGYIKEPNGWIAKSDCLLFPSITEGMPLTLSQAIQIGIPVLASDIPSVREVLPDGELIAPEDVRAWAEAIEKYLSTRRHSYNGSPQIQTFAKMAGMIEDLYYKVSMGQKTD
ncbi:MAG: glycosyltransferase family 4 protein [Synergistaceae bacterium]|nr:glycosyltransferase family 4 protein [Synergistaceae bacterium]